MISKRRKTATLRKNQRKRSNRGRRLHRMKMRGGVFPNDKIPLSKFNGVEDLQMQGGIKIEDANIPANILQLRNKELIELKGSLDAQLSNKPYTYGYFNNYIIKPIQNDVSVFRTYSKGEIPIIHHTAILPIIEEYMGAGFTLEQLLRAELEYITIDAILNVKVPDISAIADLYTRNEKNVEIRDNVQSDGITDEILSKIAGTEMQFVKENWRQKWTEAHNTILRNRIKDSIFTKLREDTDPAILPAQFIRMGFSKDYLAKNGITEIADGSSGNNTYTLKDLKTYEGGLSIRELKDARFTDDVKLKEAGFTAADFRKAKYNLKQLIALEFTEEELNQSKIMFTTADFPDNDTYLTAEKLKEAGFDAIRIHDIKMRSTTDKDQRDAAKIKIGKYLKLIGFTAQDLCNKSVYNIEDLFVAGFNYADIQLCNPELRNLYHVIHNLLSSRVEPRYTIERLGVTLPDLKQIGFLPHELEHLKIIEDASLPTLRSAGFTAEDFQKRHIKYSDDDRIVPLPYKDKPKALFMKKLGFTLEELIGIPPGLRYHLTDLFPAYEDELIDPDKFNIARIFENGKHTYGEISDVVDKYKDMTEHNLNLTRIKTKLTELKDAITNKDGKRMCDRGFSVPGKKGPTDRECKYDKARLKLEN